MLENKTEENKQIDFENNNDNEDQNQQIIKVVNNINKFPENIQIINPEELPSKTISESEFNRNKIEFEIIEPTKSNDLNNNLLNEINNEENEKFCYDVNLFNEMNSDTDRKEIINSDLEKEINNCENSN